MALEILHEVIEVHRRADRVRISPGGGRQARYRGVPEDGCFGGAVSPLEVAIRRSAAIRAAQDVTV